MALKKDGQKRIKGMKTNKTFDVSYSKAEEAKKFKQLNPTKPVNASVRGRSSQRGR